MFDPAGLATPLKSRPPLLARLALGAVPVGFR
ncbi:hypothetical protein SPHINGO8AM_160001 [Sphingomonas sp. 8AM]|nr:hypothetical protein SPHINGO8AM_160001 [Sphingomonas sp. 8AM]